MRLVVTGGGTGGHVYPALEVARLARERGAELLYLGSLRGQEGDACRRMGVLFEGFPSQPLYSLRTPRGWRSAVGLVRCVGMAKRALRASRPDAVFSTGGYSAAPVMSAARSLGVPYVIHEANSAPGRSNLMFARRAAAFACTFKTTERYTKGIPVIRTGQPIRRELREAAAAIEMQAPEAPTALVLGGSQGSAFLNDAVPAAYSHLEARGVRVIHSAGPKNIEAVCRRLKELNLPDAYDARAYLPTEEIAGAYASATLAVARSGGTVAEFALFGLPSVLIPLPTSAEDHQLHNAEEFVEMDAATLLVQPDAPRDGFAPATPEGLAAAMDAWLGDPERRERARHNLRSWDVPDATERILALVENAARKP